MPVRVHGAGDPAVLVASSAKVSTGLDWKPAFGDIGRIMETTWRWHREARY